MPYQVGVLTNPCEDDEWFTLLDDALAAARRMSKADDNLPVAVWDHLPEIERLCLCGHEFVLA